MRAADIMTIPTPARSALNYIKATIISVRADMISKMEPKLIITDGNKVIGYRHLIPMETPIATTYVIVYGKGIILPNVWFVLFWITVLFVVFVPLLDCISHTPPLLKYPTGHEETHVVALKLIVPFWQEVTHELP